MKKLLLITASVLALTGTQVYCAPATFNKMICGTQKDPSTGLFGRLVKVGEKLSKSQNTTMQKLGASLQKLKAVTNPYICPAVADIMYKEAAKNPELKKQIESLDSMLTCSEAFCEDMPALLAHILKAISGKLTGVTASAAPIFIAVASAVDSLGAAIKSDETLKGICISNAFANGVRPEEIDEDTYDPNTCRSGAEQVA